MFITKLDIQNDKELYAKVKRWASSLNTAAKSDGAPIFKVSSPMELTVRMRRSGSSVGSKENYAFRGGEEFRLANVMLEPSVERDGVTLTCIFAPSDLKLVGEISSMTLPLEKACDALDGFTDWVDVSVVENTAAQRSVKAAEQEIAHLPSVEETRASESWGAW